MAIIPSEKTANFLERLEGVRQTSNGWVARCPCRNDDNNPSLSIGQGSDGRTLVTCHRGMSCNVEEICSAVGLRVTDLMPPKDFVPARNFATDRPLKHQGQTAPKPKFVESYDYVDANGKLLFQKLRYVEESGKKTFRQRKPNGHGGWEYSLGDVPKVLYNLPAVLDASKNGGVVWVVEGEKDANRLIDMGVVATTMPGGAGKWLDIHTDSLVGAVVEIVADNDEVGKRHATEVLGRLRARGIDAQSWISASGKDISEHLDGGSQISDLQPFDGGDDGLQSETEQRVDKSSDEQYVDEILIEETTEEALSPEEQTLDRLRKLLEREDINAKQKIAKSNLIIATSTVSNVLDTGRLVQWNDFLAESAGETFEWVIPGLIERGERVIVVAAEGVGKTMLARQVGILCAAGVHPFSFQRIPSIKTLTVDLENPERIIRRTSRSIAVQAMHHAGVDRVDAYLLSKPSGMDLLKASDRAILEEALDDLQPELLVIGPLYKAFLDPGGRTSESIALEIAKYLDTIRTIYRCALWIEHHAPLGASSTTRDLRPFGSAVWSRWPEFGISLQPDPTAMGAYVYDVKHFRGARDERHWPIKMKRGKRFPFEVIDWMKVSGSSHE